MRFAANCSRSTAWSNDGQQKFEAPVLIPPSKRDLQRYVVPMLGIYPARGCPFTCNFCSVIKIAGRQIRSQSIETTMESLRNAKAAGVRLVMFTSDNFNKYAEAKELLEQMIAQKSEHAVSSRNAIHKSPSRRNSSALMARAGCFEMFVGVESFNRKTLLAAHKTQNHPSTYSEIVTALREISHRQPFFQHHRLPGRHVREHSRASAVCCANWIPTSHLFTSCVQYRGRSSTTNFLPPAGSRNAIWIDSTVQPQPGVTPHLVPANSRNFCFHPIAGFIR